jgi:hypothetical protein
MRRGCICCEKFSGCSIRDASLPDWHFAGKIGLCGYLHWGEFANASQRPLVGYSSHSVNFVGTAS